MRQLLSIFPPRIVSRKWGFAEQRFADYADAHALRQRFNRSAQSRAAGADHQHVVFMRFKTIERLRAGAQKILTS
jgi:hypothetical protein